MLIDKARIYVFGGNGGNGCQSLHKDKYHRKGVPDGGDGGPGGNVIIECSSNLQTLLDYRYNQHHKAPKGKHGGSNKKYGKKGKDIVLLVPVGTIVKDSGNGLVIRDLIIPGEKVIVAKGGAGGLGSAKIRDATMGDPGEEKVITLELKMVADAGIIGLPNAGKSTLVSRISKAHTKIAPYPFTTKSPKLGVVEYHENTFVIADMPGLIEGAHTGKGLGDRFLRHIERTGFLVHVVDMAPMNGTDPYDIYIKLEEELKLYDVNVYNKTRIVAGSKMDIPGSEENMRSFRAKSGEMAYPISAVTGYGLEELINAMYGEINNVKKETETDND